MTKHRPIEELDLFGLFEGVADWCWIQVDSWDRFAKNAVGEQLVTAADSVNANLVEGDGRYSIADSVRFFVIARASARETRLWIRRAAKRNLVALEEAESQIETLIQATKLLNLLINYRRKSKVAGVRELASHYGASRLTVELGDDAGDPFIDSEEE